MINFLKGKIEEKGLDYISLNVNNVGYKIYVAKDLLGRAEGEDVMVYTHHHIRENLMDLFGFLDKEDLNFFKILISVSGIGPKSAMGILEKAGRENINKAITLNDPDILVSGSGIGRKTAERIVADLKNKVNKIGYGAGHIDNGGNNEAVDGLVALGYSKSEIFSILKQLPLNIQETSEK